MNMHHPKIQKSVPMSALKIQKNVAIPPIKSGSSKDARRRSIWWQMVPGDSVFLPGKSVAIVAPLTATQRAEGWRFTGRTVTENGVEGVRVWRIK